MSRELYERHLIRAVEELAGALACLREMDGRPSDIAALTAALATVRGLLNEGKP